MDFDKEEKEIRDLFKGRPLKKVPEDLLKNYEAEILRKIRLGPKGIPFGVQVSLALALAAVLMTAVFYFWSVKPKSVPQAPAELAMSSPNVSIGDPKSGFPVKTSGNDTIPALPISKPVATDPAAAVIKSEVSEDALFEELADELLLLEMLNEDEGILPEADQVASDMEFFPTPAF